ncbi:MAG: hypothetical protein V2A79_08130 [Planctomycetota bacterium]
MERTKKIEKTFDCVEFKRRVQSGIYDDIKGMTFEEEQAYFERRATTGKLGEWWKRIKAASELPQR